ncbi:MAG: methyltransferase domain-containing protein [Gemmatimonadaceae bacterium]
MEFSEAVEVLRPAIAASGGTWADFGAGTGLFTGALARLLGDSGKIFAVDSDATALDALRALARRRANAEARIVPVRGDFRELDSDRAFMGSTLDGALFANALHFASDAGQVLIRAVRMLRDRGRIVVIEYDRRAANRWVPFPISVAQLGVLAEAAALQPPQIVHERPSDYGGIMYCAVLERSQDSAHS